jgi:hypothetical protein
MGSELLVPSGLSAWQESLASPPEPTVEYFTLDFGMKSITEETHDGQLGLVGKGYGTRFLASDSDGEYQVPGSLADLGETWGAEEKPPVWFSHGMDPDLGVRRVGYATSWKVDKDGLYTEFFIPKEPDPVRFQAPAAIRAYKAMYKGVKAGTIRGLSLGGTVLKVGKALMRWSMGELSICIGPSLASATFSVGAKSLQRAIKSMYGDGYTSQPGRPDYTKLWHEQDKLSGRATEKDATDKTPKVDQGNVGILSRESWNKAMGLAQKHGDRDLHDHLMSRPAQFHGAHDGEACSVCNEARVQQGIKSFVPMTKADVLAARAALLKHPGLIMGARGLLTQLEADQKAGRRHSKDTIEKISTIMETLKTTFGIGLSLPTGEGETAGDDEGALEGIVVSDDASQS